MSPPNVHLPCTVRAAAGSEGGAAPATVAIVKPEGRAELHLLNGRLILNDTTDARVCSSASSVAAALPVSQDAGLTFCGPRDGYSILFEDENGGQQISLTISSDGTTLSVDGGPLVIDGTDVKATQMACGTLT